MATETTGATGLAGRYATALFDLASSENALDQVAADLRALAAMIDGSPDLTRMVRSPVISRAEQSAAIDAILDAADAAPLTRKFAGVVAANRRLFALTDIIEGYLAILAGRRGEVTAEVASATPLTDRQQADILAALTNTLGGSVSIKASVDPDMLGGLVVRVGSRLVDSSLRTKLNQMGIAMRGSG
ncbi:MAG: F0F1 ATP synthase subunit delta [Rhodospirillaceae bacterium]|mgnify:FL=1|nr:F0F1 ATP synthase subunit delta [Rhodospirillaceae bacterium]MBT3886255.1 F0F1 ATP synthase subunit delta [Rhodospirillaceae bacterium]MBT4114906.1 F0F1 ATP synthase subunit delta [Rhodospirillaceae bacterium]MBT4671188.1 F0F1 ATP synthase subunit delta [Rhodospirillaceae bacterium]MBT4718956.1 F0F1 ATP synthase subunit delta [Rhodospirillaceae bacterium]